METEKNKLWENFSSIGGAYGLLMNAINILTQIMSFKDPKSTEHLNITLIYSFLNAISLIFYFIAYYKKRTQYVPLAFAFVAIRACLRIYDFENTYEWYTATEYFRIGI